MKVTSALLVISPSSITTVDYYLTKYLTNQILIIHTIQTRLPTSPKPVMHIHSFM